MVFYRDGFPRADVDVHAVRISRNQVIRLQNDHKALMREVEGALQALHEEARRLKELVWYLCLRYILSLEIWNNIFV